MLYCRYAVAIRKMFDRVLTDHLLSLTVGCLSILTNQRSSQQRYRQSLGICLSLASPIDRIGHAMGEKCQKLFK